MPRRGSVFGLSLNIEVGKAAVKSQSKLTYSIGNELSRPARHGALLDNNGTLSGILGNNCSDGLESSHVSCASGADTTLLCRSIDSDQDNISFANALGDIRGEEEIGGTTGYSSLAIFGRGHLALGGALVGKCKVARAIAGNADNVVQARLVNGRVARVPAANANFVSIDNRHLDVRVLEGDDSSGRTT